VLTHAVDYVLARGISELVAMRGFPGRLPLMEGAPMRRRRLVGLGCHIASFSSRAAFNTSFRRCNHLKTKTVQRVASALALRAAGTASQAVVLLLGMARDPLFSGQVLGLSAGGLSLRPTVHWEDFRTSTFLSRRIRGSRESAIAMLSFLVYRSRH